MIYFCKCYKCQQNFDSENELDKDEYSYCLVCFEEQKKIKIELDKKIKPVATPRKEMKWIPAGVPGGKLYLDI